MDEMNALAIDALDDYNLTDEIEESYQEQEENSPEEASKTTTEQTEENNSEEPSNNNESPEENQEKVEDTLDSFTKEVLRLKGINNPDKIKFQDESGAIVERSWKDLSTNEKLSIVTLEEDTDTDLEDEEIQFINMLRENKLTPSQYMQLFQNNIIQHIQDNQPSVYEVDNLTDDELFALDLIERLGEDNVTDDELKQAIEQAKANEDLYKKQVSALRSRYQDLENQRKYEEEQAQQAQFEQNYKEFSDKILNQIEGFENIAGQEIELSIDDKNDIANYILTRDDTGQSDFYKDLQNPQALTTAAFWILKGPEIMQELQKQIQDAYKRGFNLGKATQPEAQPKPETAKVVITPKQETSSKTIINNDATAAFGDDESYLYN